MKISAQEEYGLRCLMQIARRGDQASLSITEIAEAEGLSAPYAAKLLALLRQEGFIESTRGRSGGYRLNRPPLEIRLGSVLTALGEHLFSEGDFCQKHAGTETSDGACVHAGGACNLRSLWQTLESWMRLTLDGLTLADLLQNDQSVAELMRQRLALTLTAPADEPVELIPLNVRPRPAGIV
jgi:Rrf2 family protein